MTIKENATLAAKEPSSQAIEKSAPEAGDAVTRMPAGREVFAFEVSVKGTDWAQIINARTAARAKSEYHRDVIDAWPDVPFTAIRCRKVGAPRSSSQFVRNAIYRGLPDVRCGHRVRVGESFGAIVGHDSSALFEVLFDADAPRYAGLKLSVHPSEMIVQVPETSAAS